MRQVDKVDQLTQASLVTTAEGEGQAGEMGEFRVIEILAVITLLLEALTQANIGKCLPDLLQRLGAERAFDAHHKGFVHPAGRMEVGVKLIDLSHRLFCTVHQA